MEGQMASRAEKLRRRQNRKDKNRRQAQGPTWHVASPHRIVVNPPGREKMSEALVALVQPEWDSCQSEEAMKKLLTIGIVAWNAALRTGEERTALLEETAASLPAEVRGDREIVEVYIRRKEELFPKNKRPMFDFELSWRSGNPHNQVLSGLA
jgi:hypothetical protein